MGIVVGVNPLLGSTTVLALALAGVFRLNVAASQLGNHLFYPLELLLFPVWIKLGTMLFHTEGLPMEPKVLFAGGEAASVGDDAGAVALGVARDGGVGRGGLCGSAADCRDAAAGAAQGPCGICSAGKRWFPRAVARSTRSG